VLAAPKGVIDDAAVSVCLKAYPDTNLEFLRKLLHRAWSFVEIRRQSFSRRAAAFIAFTQEADSARFPA
jgi:hypothetical protein